MTKRKECCSYLYRARSFICAFPVCTALWKSVQIYRSHALIFAFTSLCAAIPMEIFTSVLSSPNQYSQDRRFYYNTLEEEIQDERPLIGFRILHALLFLALCLLTNLMMSHITLTIYYNNGSNGATAPPASVMLRRSLAAATHRLGEAAAYGLMATAVVLSVKTAYLKLRLTAIGYSVILTAFTLCTVCMALCWQVTLIPLLFLEDFSGPRELVTTSIQLLRGQYHYILLAILVYYQIASLVDSLYQALISRLLGEALEEQVPSLVYSLVWHAVLNPLRSILSTILFVTIEARKQTLPSSDTTTARCDLSALLQRQFSSLVAQKANLTSRSPHT